MTNTDQHIYEFAHFQLDASEHLLLRDGISVPITSKAFETLLVLIQRAGHLVEKSDLIKIVWKNSFVEEGNLAVTISMLRKALGDDGNEQKYIKTVARLGYRFVADVRTVATPQEPNHVVEVPPPVFPIAAEEIHKSVTGSTGWPRYVSVTVGVLILGLVSLAVLWPSSAKGWSLKSAFVTKPVYATMGQFAQSKSEMQEGSAEAKQLYLEGRFYLKKGTKPGLRQSVEFFQRATLKDPNYAEAYAGLADSYVRFASFGIEPAQDAYPIAKAAALKALQLDGSLAEAHTALGQVAFLYEWNWSNADAEFQRAIRLDSNYAMAHTCYANYLSAMGRLDQALKEAQHGADLDPLSVGASTTVGRVYYFSRHFDLSIAALRHAIQLDPYYTHAHTQLGMSYAATGDYSSAILEFQKASQLSGPASYLDGLSGYAQGRIGKSEASHLMMVALTDRSRLEYIPPFSMALISIGLGDHEEALGWLTKAYQDRSHFLIFAKVDPLLDPERSDPRFKDLLTRMSLP